MGKIFGAIVGLIKAIFGVVLAVLKFPLKLFGGGKKSDYFLEADDWQASSSAPSDAGSAPKKKAPAAAPAKSSASPAPATQSAAPAASSTPASANQSAAPEPAMVAATPSAPEQNGSLFSKPVENVTFAPEKLLTLKTSGSRRRPGPSLSPFKDMARQMSMR